MPGRLRPARLAGRLAVARAIDGVILLPATAEKGDGTVRRRALSVWLAAFNPPEAASPRPARRRAG